jgi:hypothetical protein
LRFSASSEILTSTEFLEPVHGRFAQSLNWVDRGG